MMTRHEWVDTGICHIRITERLYREVEDLNRLLTMVRAAIPARLSNDVSELQGVFEEIRAICDQKDRPFT